MQTPRAFICLGVSVGPDGNIYSVGTEGPGVFSLTPAGTLRWQRPEAYDRRIVDYAEILFGPNVALSATLLRREKDFGVIDNPPVVRFGSLPAQRARRCQ